MNDPANPHRRRLLFGLLALPVTSVVHAALATPSATEGPFYPSSAMRYDDSDHDLVKIGAGIERAGGEVVRFGGRVLERDGNPVAAARVEIWQCDVNGRYLHRGDSGGRSRDQGFQGFGHDLTGADGAYEFRTIKPVPYPGRTPHIHLKILLRGRERLTTQLYLPDHPLNARDWLYQQVSPAQRDLISLRFDSSQPEPRATVDLII